jgi:hypothetical protein
VSLSVKYIRLRDLEVLHASDVLDELVGPGIPWIFAISHSFFHVLAGCGELVRDFFSWGRRGLR